MNHKRNVGKRPTRFSTDIAWTFSARLATLASGVLTLFHARTRQSMWRTFLISADELREMLALPRRLLSAK